MTTQSNNTSINQASSSHQAERLIVANWKMNGSLQSNQSLLDALLAKTDFAKLGQSVHVAVCPPSVYLDQVATALRDSAVSWGAQDLSVHDNGAYTGEISTQMLRDFSCQWVIVGHSERRLYHGETDQAVAQKAKCAAQAGIKPIVCVGETQEQYENGETLSVIEAQLAPVLELDVDLIEQMVVAYEPVWAIGTGLTATPEQAQTVHAHIRKLLASKTDAYIKIIYGGSVKADNAVGLFEMPDIDGALVGGASLKAEEFSSIICA